MILLSSSPPFGPYQLLFASLLQLLHFEIPLVLSLFCVFIVIVFFVSFLFIAICFVYVYCLCFIFSCRSPSHCSAFLSSICSVLCHLCCTHFYQSVISLALFGRFFCTYSFLSICVLSSLLYLLISLDFFFWSSNHLVLFSSTPV